MEVRSALSPIGRKDGARRCGVAAPERLKFAAWPRGSQVQHRSFKPHEHGRASPALGLAITHLVHLDVVRLALLCLSQDLQLIFLGGTGTVSLELFPSHDRSSKVLSFGFKTIEAILYIVV